MNKLILSIFLAIVLFSSASAITTQTVTASTVIVPDDYLTIQEAVNHAKSGDTVYVRSGIYFEKQLTINKSIKLVGENRSTTFVEGNNSWVCIYVQNAYNVEIHNFTVRRGYGVYLHASHNVTISNNIITANGQGIILLNSTNNTIKGNLVAQNGAICILLSGSDDNLVAENIIMENRGDAVWVEQSKGNVIRENNISRNGLSTPSGYHVYGVRLSYSSGNKVYHNNIIDNFEQANGWQSINNTWDDGFPSGGNYWSDYKGIDNDNDGIGDTPYTIDANNADRCPLMKLWSAAPSGTQERKVGVKAGDWALYDVVSNYSTNDPNPPVRPISPNVTDIVQYKLEVIEINGTRIAYRATAYLRDGTEISFTASTNVSSNYMEVFPPPFIAANLTAGDRLYNDPNSIVINATLTKTYAGAEKEVNYANLTQDMLTANGYRLTGKIEAYWDRESGLIDELTQNSQYVSGNLTTKLYGHLDIKETNAWRGRLITITDADTGLSYRVLKEDSSFTVNITLNGVTDYLHSFQVAIAFDNKKIKCTAAWISRNDPSFVFHNASNLMSFATVQNRFGCLAIGSSLGIDMVIPDHQLLRYTNVSGTKLLCQINFTAVEAGNSSLQFITRQPSPIGYNTALFDANNTPLSFAAEEFAIVATVPTKIPIRVFVTPIVLNLKSQARWITAVIMLPKGCYINDADFSSIRLNGTISAERVTVLLTERRSLVIIKFDRQTLIDLIMSTQPLAKHYRGIIRFTLNLSGTLADGITFQSNAALWVLWKMPRNGNQPWN